MKACNKHGWIDSSPDAKECPACRVEQCGHELQEAQGAAVFFSGGFETQPFALARAERARVAHLEAVLAQVRDALTRCTCMCKWVKQARTALEGLK